MDDYFRIGVIANTQALRGELKVFPTTDDPSRFDDMTSVTIVRAGEYSRGTTYPVEGVHGVCESFHARL